MSKEQEQKESVTPEVEETSQSEEKKPAAKKAAKKATKKRGRPKKPEYTNNPPLKEEGPGFNAVGLRNGVNYSFTEEGLVDWKEMIPDEFIVISKSYLDEHQIDPSEVSEEEMAELKSAVPERDLVILLGGFKYLARLRGFLDCSYETLDSRDGYYATKCKVIFRPTYENGGMPFAVEAQANASVSNTSPPFDKFLESIAENRAFIRVIRTALNINIVGSDEVEGILSDLDPSNARFIEGNKTVTVQGALRAHLKEKNKSWEDFYNFMKEKGEPLFDEKWGSFEDIPDSVATELMGKITKSGKNEG